MGQTIAQALEEKGLQKGLERGREEGIREGKQEGKRDALRQTLLQLLRQRFGELPSDTVAVIDATTHLSQLEKWLQRVLTAKSLTDMGIRSRTARPS